MSEGLFDLDAAKAAQRETLGEPFQFSFAGEKYEIPPSMDWPVEVFTHMAAKDFRAAMHVLLAANTPGASERFLAAKPTLGHFELVFDEGPARDVDQGLGDRLGERMQSGGPAPGQDGHGDAGQVHRHWTTTLVPSKSKRKRTSRSPACVIARRSRVLSSA
jgi:hypothetical protein